MKLKSLGEFALIERIGRKIHKSSSRVLVGIGDDASVVRTRKGKFLVVTTDTLIEGIHFDLSYFSYFCLGWKALSSNISDCIAMGGGAKEILVTLGLPNKIRVEDVDELYRGINALARKHGIDIIGGDTVSSPTHLVISITLLGEVERKNLMLRSGAKAGDLILVTGDLGGSAAGLKLLQITDYKLPITKAKKLIHKHLMPDPRVAESEVIAKSGNATSMIDNSDGLARCVIEICRMSGVGARLKLNAIPMSAGTKTLSKSLRVDPLDLALYGGEDYELVFTAPKSAASRIAKAVKKKTKTPVTIVGEIVGKRKGIMLVEESGTEKPLKSGGYEHLM